MSVSLFAMVCVRAGLTEQISGGRLLQSVTTSGRLQIAQL